MTQSALAIRQERLRSMLAHELGPEILAALGDPEVLDLVLNPDGSIWTATASGMFPLVSTMEAGAAEALISTVASLLDKVITAEQPILEGILPFHVDLRFTGVLPPVSDAPIFAIRKRASHIFDLEADYVQKGLLSSADAQTLRHSLIERRNIIVSGGTGSGKTSLVNALLREIEVLDPGSRCALLEDTAELHVPSSNSFRLLATTSIPIAFLLRTVLRLLPSRIVVGEVRGAEAHTLLKAWNTGHPGGLATVHANSAPEAFLRLDQLAQEAGVPSQAALIAQTVHLVVHLAGRGSQLRVQDLVQVEGLGPDGFRLRSLRRVQ
ncbi:MAG TPA: P-type conjugative transfer ATPase TrbB [Gemmatimonadales bacterium]|nr:P-type conjugative transfer ATPase TrbB [Gemmatimonadales bacterium]